MRFLVSLLFMRRFCGYVPRRITPYVIWRFIMQFPREMRWDVLRLLESVRYLDKNQTEDLLVGGCRDLVLRLLRQGVQQEYILIVPAHSVGNSAPYCFELVRSALSQEFPYLKFHREGPAKARDLLPFGEDSCVIFVDDFIGTGDQFTKSFKAWAGALSSRTERFVLVAVVACSEGKKRIEDEGAAQVEAAIEHTQGERFVEVAQQLLGEERMQRLMVLACELRTAQPFGHGNGGSLVVIHRNCPNNVPSILRGTDGQRIWFGLFPRLEQMQPKSFDTAMGQVRMRKK